MQIQAFAAARRSALWDDVRAEIAAEVDTAGGRSQETEGTVRDRADRPGAGGAGTPAWACGSSGSSASTAPAGSCAACSPAGRGGGEPGRLLEEVLRDVVVVRGEHPVPPRDILELRLPPEAQQALEEQGRRGRGEPVPRTT